MISESESPRVLCLAAASGLLLYASFFPLNLGFLAWVAFVPWLFLVRMPSHPRHLYLKAWLGALCFTLPAMQWMRVAHEMMHFTWIGLALYTSAYFVVGLALCRKLDRSGVPLFLSFPLVWVSLEYCRAHFPTGFAWLEPLGVQHLIGFGWYFLGHTQHDFLEVIQIADMTGVYGITFLIGLANVAVFSWVNRLTSTVPATPPRLATVLAVVCLGTTLVYGMARLSHAEFQVGPRVAALQGNIPQEIKMMKGDDLLQPYLDLWMKARFPSDGSPPPVLTIWPETSCPDDWLRLEDGTNLLVNYTGKSSDLMDALTRRGKTLGEMGSVLLGLNTLEIEPGDQRWKYNSAVLLHGRMFVGRYDKMHLVPFGEYVPLGNIFPWLQMFTPYKNAYSCKPGELWTRFPLRAGDTEYTFATIICYEDSEPYLPRQYVRSGPRQPVDFFVNISNDGWFRGTEEHEQHLAICRFRAVETRKSFVRAVNMGVSAIIDPDGRVVALPGDSWSHSKAMSGIVVGDVPLDTRKSLYAEWGDWLPVAAGGVLALLLILRPFRRSPGDVA